MTIVPESFQQRLRRHAERAPDVPALVHAGESIAYGTLAAEVDALARALAAERVGTGALFALTARDEIDHALATLALMALGVPQVALGSHDPPAMRARLASRVGATVVLGDRPEDAPPGLRWIALGEARRRARERPHGGDPLPPHSDAAALHFTGSGTTGEPKVVAFTERQLAMHAETHVGCDGRRVLRPAHIEYNNSRRQRLYTLWRGATCVFADDTCRSLRAQCERDRPDWLELSLVHASDLVAACREEGPLGDQVNLRVGGARVPHALRRELIAAASPRLYVSYGTTETSFVAVADPSMHDATESVGPPAPHASVGVLRADGAPAAPGEIGEIRLKTPGMASAYVGDADATARHFRDGWFLPGDLASLDERGRLSIHGRKDDMMILNGINIFPSEIERVLEAHPAVACAAAFAVASDIHGQIPAAAVELRGGSAATSAELVAYARARLGTRAPRRVEIVVSLPRNAQGKVPRREVARLFGERSA